MKHFLLTLLLSGCCSIASADEPRPPAKITIPDIATIPRDTMLVISSDAPLIILQSPDKGILKITSVVSPLSIFGRFADGDGSSEFRQFSEPHLWVVTGAKAGTTELILIQLGVESADQIVRRTLTIAGQGPQPPPGPEPDPGPLPEPLPVAEHVRLTIVEDSTNRKPETAILLNALVGWDELQAAGHDYRLYDKDTTEPGGVKAVVELDGITPGIVVTDKDTGKTIHKGPLPVKFADLKFLVGSLTGG